MDAMNARYSREERGGKQEWGRQESISIIETRKKYSLLPEMFGFSNQ